MKRNCMIFLAMLLLGLGTAHTQTPPAPQELPNPYSPPNEEMPAEEPADDPAEEPTEKPAADTKPDNDFPSFAISYYAPSWFGLASGEGSLFSGFAETEPETRLLVPLEFRVALRRWQDLTVAASLAPALYAENHRPASLNLSAGVGIFYNKLFGGKSATSPLSGLYLMLYPLSDIPLATGGRNPVYRWKVAIEHGYAVAFNPAPIPLYLGCYLRWIVGWQDTDHFHGIDFGLTVGVLFL